AAPCSTSDPTTSCGPEGGPGAVHVYLGGEAGVASSPSATLRPGDGGHGLYGWSMASAGDVNGDGYADVIIADSCVGAADDCGPDRVYLHLGGPGGLGEAREIPRPAGVAHFAWSVASAGDLDGDGHGDVIVGTACLDGGDPSCEPGAYVYRGTDTG